MSRRGFNFEDTYDVQVDLKRGGWKAASMLASGNADDIEETTKYGRRWVNKNRYNYYSTHSYTCVVFLLASQNLPYSFITNIP